MTEPTQPKVLTADYIYSLTKDFHRCGWTTGAVKNPNPACGCMCGTVYNEKGESILRHGGWPRGGGPQCKCFPDKRIAATPPQIEKRDYVKEDREEAQRYIDAFIAEINADHSDVIHVPRDVGCCMRNEIERLRKVERASLEPPK